MPRAAVVQDEHLHRHAVDGGRGHLLGVHLERPVAGDADHLVVRAAEAAPMAAGKPKPMVPRPPEEMNVRGISRSMNCAAHI